MNDNPQTRHSLILRLRNREDVDAWREFVSIYEPVIYRVAIGRGMQHADALELVQRVLLAVTRAVDRFQPDRRRAKFRTWLFRITHNEFCKEFASAKKHRASGDSAVQVMLEQLPGVAANLNGETSNDFSIEFRRAVFRWAANKVEPRVKASTWQAFWRTSVDGLSVEAAAKELGLSVGAIYIARSRVMARLQKCVRKYDAQTETKKQ